MTHTIETAAQSSSFYLAPLGSLWWLLIFLTHSHLQNTFPVCECCRATSSHIKRAFQLWPYLLFQNNFCSLPRLWLKCKWLDQPLRTLLSYSVEFPQKWWVLYYSVNKSDPLKISLTNQKFLKCIVTPPRPHPLKSQKIMSLGEI